ncbi:SDR family oxidoreductase [Pontibacter anaerobius]|uniref:SDR family NAD(P)-dependent oxidoreductase n=1 Tax=Pontibacter anaerobius TaxID=2993940 RepID=A0ABT3RAA0_9BACT|nr:SDR family oxidoreductase [Pontibacter anaerobius]MCX2738788.1 SDR family NAD(P)-dependent oxidoreductase [Pontibacter anaerobius]
MKLENANILITGGTLGIGHSTAKLLIEKGANVAITGRDEKRTHKAARDIGAMPITADVANPDDVKRTFKTFMNEYGKLDALINNAGIGVSKPVEELTVEDFQRIYSVNVFGAAMMAGRAAEIFKKQNFGNIINIGSTAALKGYEGGSVYASSKAALRSMTQSWQTELRKYNVRVMLVNPSEVTTAFGQPDRQEREDQPNKLRSEEIAWAIKSALQMDNRGFIPELSVWATNPF